MFISFDFCFFDSGRSGQSGQSGRSGRSGQSGRSGIRKTSYVQPSTLSTASTIKKTKIKNKISHPKKTNNISLIKIHQQIKIILKKIK